MKDNRDSAPPTMPIEILKNVDEIIRHVSPDVLLTLGGIATNGTTSEDQAWVDELGDVAQAIQDRLAVIFAAINETTPAPPELKVTEKTPTSEVDLRSDEPTAEEDSSTTEVVELTELEEQILAYAMENGAFRVEELKKTIPELANADPKAYRSFKHKFARIRERIAERSMQQAEPANWVEGDGVKRAKTYEFVLDGQEPKGVLERPKQRKRKAAAEVATDQNVEATNEKVDLSAITEKGLSPNEQQAIRQAVAYLQGFEERKSLRDIVSTVFGRSRLPRNEEARMAQILDNCVTLGLLRSYGKTYGYKSTADQAIANEVTLPIDTEEELNEMEKTCLEYIRTFAENGEMNIGQVVRGYWNEKRVVGNRFKLMVDTLNSLAGRGYLVHAENSPWYALPKHEDQTQPAVESQSVIILAEIKTPVANLLPSEPVVHTLIEDEVVILQAKPEPNRTAEQTIETTEYGVDLSSYGLSDREINMTLAILNSATPGEWFRQSEVDLCSIPFSSIAAQRQAYGKLTQKLVEQGLLTDNGKARGGKKYQLSETLISLLGDVQKVATQDVVEQPAVTKAPSTTKTQTPKYFDKIAAERDQAAQTPEESLTAREELARFRRAAGFTMSLSNNIARDLLESTEDQTERYTKAVEYIADGLNIAKDVAQVVLKSLVDNEHFFTTSGKGMKMLTKLPPQNGDRTKREQSKQIDAEHARIVALKELYGPAILTFLSTLNKEQTVWKTAIVAAVDGLEYKDVNKVCNLMQTEGLVRSKEEQGRGSRIGRKGKTWAIAPGGRRLLSELAKTELTNAEKRKILSGFRR